MMQARMQLGPAEVGRLVWGPRCFDKGPPLKLEFLELQPLIGEQLGEPIWGWGPPYLESQTAQNHRPPYPNVK